MKLPDWWIPWARSEAHGTGWIVVNTALGRKVTVEYREVRELDDEALAALVCGRCEGEDGEDAFHQLGGQPCELY